MLLILALAQATASIDFDLGKLERPIAACQRGSAEDIIVCAPRITRDNRVDPAPAAEPLPLLPKAELGLFGNVRGKVIGQAGEIAGIPTNRAMVVVTVPF